VAQVQRQGLPALAASPRTWAMARSSELPSASSEKPSTAKEIRNAVSSPRLPPSKVRTPSNSENTAPDTKMNTAASNAQKKRSLP
jgi:hypothetical protein